MKNIGTRITSLRLEKGLSLSALASLSEISKSLLHRIENAPESNPELSTLKKIARALNTTVGDLIGNEVVMSARQLPLEIPPWLSNLTARLRGLGREPDQDFLEALYVLQNRKGAVKASDEDWYYLYQTLEKSFQR